MTSFIDCQPQAYKSAKWSRSIEMSHKACFLFHLGDSHCKTIGRRSGQVR